MSNRQYKFRAWDKDIEKMIIPNKNDVWHPVIRMLDGKNYVDRGTSKNWILLQFTGLTDKNGKEIYEGDVVKWQGAGMLPCEEEVAWDVDYCGFILKDSQQNPNIKCEVIGNVYEGLYSGEKPDMIEGWKNNTEKPSQTPLKDTSSAKKQNEKLG